MIRIFLPLICAALGFAAASCSQSEKPLAPAAETTASPPPTTEGAASAATPGAPDPMQASDQAPPDQAPSSDAPSSDAQSSDAPPPDAPSSAAPPSDAASTSAASQSAASESPDTAPNAGTQRRATSLMGMPVVAADGNALGEVKDIMFDRQGHASHVVIAYGNPPASDSKLTAMPWDAAMASIKDGRLVLEDAQLEGAPSFTAGTYPNLDDPTWSTATDAYWRKAVQAAIAAHPGAPVDSPSRERRGRERPDRDGN